jgi:hypothetical protein
MSSGQKKEQGYAITHLLHGDSEARKTASLHCVKAGTQPVKSSVTVNDKAFDR